MIQMCHLAMGLVQYQPSLQNYLGPLAALLTLHQ